MLCYVMFIVFPYSIYFILLIIDMDSIILQTKLNPLEQIYSNLISLSIEDALEFLSKIILSYIPLPISSKTLSYTIELLLTYISLSKLSSDPADSLFGYIKVRHLTKFGKSNLSLLLKRNVFQLLLLKVIKIIIMNSKYSYLLRIIDFVYKFLYIFIEKHMFFNLEQHILSIFTIRKGENNEKAGFSYIENIRIYVVGIFLLIRLIEFSIGNKKTSVEEKIESPPSNLHKNPILKCIFCDFRMSFVCKTCSKGMCLACINSMIGSMKCCGYRFENEIEIEEVVIRVYDI